ncbi:MAG: lipopolysaccharide assembly protein LapA domain-containing protein [Acetobacteraceae bacterium]|nr:lipopolysaccharide assembly protein LapA domain-containing protein [Acetobacteraceae bacterium]
MLLFLALLLIVLVAVFAVQNAFPVAVTFFAWSFETSLVLVILGAAVLGALTVGVLGLLKQVRLNVRLWGTRGQVRRLEAELAQARARCSRLEEELARASAGQAGGPAEGPGSGRGSGHPG